MTISNQSTAAQRRALMALQAGHYTKPQGLSAACTHCAYGSPDWS